MMAYIEGTEELRVIVTESGFLGICTLIEELTTIGEVFSKRSPEVTVILGAARRLIIEIAKECKAASHEPSELRLTIDDESRFVQGRIILGLTEIRTGLHGSPEISRCIGDVRDIIGLIHGMLRPEATRGGIVIDGDMARPGKLKLN